MNTNITLLGVLFLGGFVGLLFGLVVQFTQNISLKLAVSVVGAALGGAPVLFMSELHHEKWMYPIGLVIGFLWVRVITARQAIGKRPKSADRPAWIIGWIDTLAILVVTGGVVAAAAFVHDEGTDPANNARKVTRQEMPCRWAWVYLGRYNPKERRYESGPWFRPETHQTFPSPIPKPGDSIVLTSNRDLLITGFAQAPQDERCGDNLLQPPWGDSPSTHSKYVAGKLPANTQVFINLVQLMPFDNAEPTYVWALVGPQE